ncbi:MAG: ATP-binding protein [Synergistaceae bacterium]|nr:ATP-binding protein [Synergistaceae bacterium]
MVSYKIKAHERDAVIKSLAAGVIPTIGLHHIQVDRKDEILAILGDLERIEEGGAAARFVVGNFGAGKSFFLNLTKSVAMAKKFVVMQADIAMKRRLASTTGYARALYAELVYHMSIEARPDGAAFDNVMEKWARDIASQRPEGFDVDAAVREELSPLQNMAGGFNFISVAAQYCKSVLSGNEKTSRAAQKWLSGGFGKITEAKAELAVESFINDKDIYDYLKIWAVFVRLAGFSGLLVMMDEMGLLAQGLSNHATRDGNYEVILQILNDCLQGRASGIGFIFAGANFFLDDPKNGLMGHGALASRLAPNPFARNGLKDLSTPVIRLGEFTPEDLYLLFENIREIFAMGDKSKYLIPDEAIQSFMNLCAWSLGEDFYKNPRDAVKLFTGFLSVLRQNSGINWQNILDGAVIGKSGSEIQPGSAFPGHKQESEPIFEPVVPPVSELDEIPSEIEILSETEAAFGTDEISADEEHSDGKGDAYLKFELDFDPDIGGVSNYASECAFELGPGPALYAVKPRPETYEPNLYILPGAGLSRDIPQCLAEPERRGIIEIAAAEPFISLAALAAAAQGEDDMRVGHVLHGNENDLKVFLPNMISRNPLIGMERIPPGVRNDLVRMSGKILINSHNGYLPNSYEKMLLSVTLIDIAKHWTSDDEKLFWNFIGRRLGFEKDTREALYGTMCNAVFETMKSHHRFFSHDRKTNKKEFYVTIMAHALAASSMYSLFDFLFEFYLENLRCRVIKGDSAVGVMASELRHRFGESGEPWNVRLKGKYSGINAGLAAIIVKRPKFFRKFVEEILMKMEELASGSRFENATYLDELLNTWSGQKASLEIARDARRPGLKFLPAVTYGEIRPRYEAANTNSVDLVIPPVRLDAESPGMDARVGIMCGDSRHFEDLRVYGDEFARTIEEKRIALSGLSRFESSRDLMIKAIISAGGKTVYDSETSLYRDIIVFRGNDEIPPQSVRNGLYSVFSSIDKRLSFDESADDRVVPASSGQMRAVKFGRKYSVAVDGRLIHAGPENASLGVVISAEPCRGAAFLRRGNEYSVYTERFRVIVRVPERHDLSRYAFKLGGSEIPFRKCVVRNFEGMAECAVKVTPDLCDDGIFDAAVTDADRDGEEVLRICCCLIEGLGIAFDRPYYFEDANGGMVAIDANSRRIEWPLGDGEYVVVPFEDGELKIKVPLVFWRTVPSLGDIDKTGKTGKKRRTRQWHASIPPETRLEVVCPDEAACKLKLGHNIVEGAAKESGLVVFNLGESMRAAEFGRDEEIVQAELLIESADDNCGAELFSICLKERFDETPRFEIRDGVLSLKNHWAFVGPRDGRLEYSFKGKVGESYVVRAGDSVISRKCGLFNGNYRYRIFTLSGDEAAPEKKVIMSGSCILGDSDMLHFDNKLLEIRRARAGFKEFFIQPVYVEKLEFAGARARYDDGVLYPVYEGVCYNINREDKKVYFGDDFNPVQIVIINGRDVCLYRKDGGKPCLVCDSRHKIAAEAPDPESGMAYCIPDFYEYEALDEN